MIQKSNEMHVVVTGASGFLGGHVAEALLERGISVVAVARRELRLWRRPLLRGAKIVIVTSYLETPVSKTDILLHLAEDATGGGSTFDQTETVKFLLAKGARRFVYGSSAVVYGDRASTPRTPDHCVAPMGDYAIAKRDREKLVLAATGGVVARLSNLYGPEMSQRNVLSEILAYIEANDIIKLKSLAPIRDYIWVTDAAKGLVEIALGKKKGAFNLGTGVGTSVRELAQVICKELHVLQPKIDGPEGDCESSLILDSTTTTDAFGWRPRVSLPEGMALLCRQ